MARSMQEDDEEEIDESEIVDSIDSQTDYMSKTVNKQNWSYKLKF